MSLNKKVLFDAIPHMPKSTHGGSHGQETLEERRAREKKEREARSQATLDWLKANQNPNWPKNFDKYMPREGSSVLPRVTKANKLMIPGATNFNLNDYTPMQIENYQGYPIYEINGKWVVGDHDFNQQFAQPYQRHQNRGDIVIQYGRPETLKLGGLAKHFLVNESQGNSVSLSKTDPMNRSLKKAENGAQTQDAQIQMMQQIAQMLQQGTAPEEIVQGLVQQGMPQEQAVQMIQAVAQQAQGDQGPTHTMPNGTEMPGASHEEYMAQQQKHLGGVLNPADYKVPFAKLGKEMTKDARKAGETKDDMMDTSSTEAYATSLKNALQRHLFSGYAVNKIQNDFKQAGQLFNQIPKAENGIEIADDGIPFFDQNKGEYHECLKKYGVNSLDELLAFDNEKYAEVITGLNEDIWNDSDLKKKLDGYGYTLEQYRSDPEIKTEVE